MSAPSDRLYDGHVARARSLARADADELFIHFGHWDDPASAAPAQFRDAQRRLNDHLLALAGPLGGTIVDVGCGLGGTLATVAARTRGARLCGINIDPRQLALARALVAPGENRLVWCAADACALPLADASVDLLLAVECIPHFRSRATFLAEAARVLAPGGRLVLSDFVATDELRAERPALDPRLGAAVTEGLAPWSDFWSAGAEYRAATPGGAFTVGARVDASAATLPSYACILGARFDPSRFEPTRFASAEERGMAALGHLQSRALVRLCYLRLDRVESPI